MSAGGKWVDREAGPVVRPYALTGGRTEPVSGEVLDLVAVVVAARPPGPGVLAPGLTAPGGHLAGSDAEPPGIGPEHRRIMALCERPATVADLASATSLPVGVVRVLLADLILQGRIDVLPQRPTGEQPSADLLKEVLHGLRAL